MVAKSGFQHSGRPDATNVCPYLEVSMFKCVMFFLLLIISVTTSSPAFAAFSDFAYPYLGVTIGSPLTSIRKLSDSSGSLTTDFKPGYMAGVTAGVAFDSWLGWNIERIRAEAEIAYRSSNLTKMTNSKGLSYNASGTVSVTNIMMNGYLENSSMLSRDLPVTVFLTAGAGAAMASISSISYQGKTLVNSASNTQLAYQGGLGAGYELTKKITLDATYKYLGTTAFKFGGINAEYGSHTVLLGARYTFK